MTECAHCRLMITLLYSDPWDLWTVQAHQPVFPELDAVVVVGVVTYIKYCDGEMTANGWRDLQNYFDMRDLLGMAYNTW